MAQPDKPRLRPVEFQPVTHSGQRMWLLRDPYRLSDRQLIVPAALAQMLLYCDGSCTPAELHHALCTQVGERVPDAIVHDALAQLDDALLLDNERAAAAIRRLLDEYRSASCRPAALAGLAYPADPTELAATFRAYLNGSSADADQPTFRGRGIVSPHIDYARGGPVYARVWQQATPALLEADLVVILGTDHKGGRGTLTLTRQPYATPYGVIPTDDALVDRLAAAIGPEAAFADELHHRDEHSIELSAVWLHHVFRQAGREPCPMLPVLVGSFHHFVMNGDHPAHDYRLNRFLETLAEQTRGRRVLTVASVDLAHVGPAFGDPFDMDQPRREALGSADAELLGHMLHGDAAGFYQSIATIEDRNRICGFSPIYLLLRGLGTTGGRVVDYRHCPADPQDTSLVSICGVLLD